MGTFVCIVPSNSEVGRSVSKYCDSELQQLFFLRVEFSCHSRERTSPRRIVSRGGNPGMSVGPNGGGGLDARSVLSRGRPCAGMTSERRHGNPRKCDGGFE